MASASGLARPLSFFVVAAIRPWRVAPAPENWPAIVAGLSPAVLATW